MPADRPTPSVLRAMSDQTVAQALISGRRMTRAELSVATGLSKPTVNEAIRRLEAKGLVSDTGVRTTGRGGVGTYYELDSTAGIGLAVAIAPEGIAVEALDVTGNRLARAERDVDRPATPAAVRKLLANATRSVMRIVGVDRFAVAVVSAADPVDRPSGRLVQLRDAPFLVGELDPVAALSAFVEGAVRVDNDVNWAARHEQAARIRLGEPMADFAYLYLGEGLGCAVVADGEVRRGHNGLAGEVSHVLTVGPGNAAMPFIAVFDRLGVRRPRSTAVDLDALTSAFGRPRRLATVAKAVAGVVSAIVAVADPSTVILAGPWGSDPLLIQAVRDAVSESARPVPIEAPREPSAAALAGARASTLDQLHQLIAVRSAN